MQGYPQVINVVTQENRRAYYDVAVEVQRPGTGDVDQENERTTQLDGTGSFSSGGHEFTVTGFLQDRSNRSPTGFVAIDPANPEQRISSLNSFDRREEGVQFDGAFALPGDSVLSFNSQFRSDTRGSMPLPLAVDGEVESVVEGSDREEDLRDFSAEYRRPLATKGELMVAFVDTTSTEQSEAIFETVTSSRFSSNDSETGETATRLLITNSPTDRLFTSCPA